MVIQHISYDHLEDTSAQRWTWYVLFTLAVGVLLLLNWMGWLASVAGVNTAILIALFGGYKIYYKAISALFERRITADLAIVIAIAAALVIGEYLAAAEAVFIMLVGEGLEEFASRRTRAAIEKLIDMTPQTARVKSGDTEREVGINEVHPDDIVIVRPGERIPVDGLVAGGSSSVNEAPVTGESLPVSKWPGDTVHAGSVNTAGALEIRVTRVGEDTTLGRIIALIREAENNKAPVVRLADRYAQWFLPLLLIIAAATWYFTGDWLRTVAVLLVACPCALILAVPAAMVAAIGRLARDGVLVRGGAALETLAGVDCLVFDKTGTITEGRPVITDITCLNGHTENELLQLAAMAEQRSEHAIARLIVDETRARGLDIGAVEEFTVDPGLGVEALANGHRVIVGNRRMMTARQIEISAAAEAALSALEQEGRSPVIIAGNGEIQGLIGVQDGMRAAARMAIDELRRLGIKRTVMLTGDRQTVARDIGRNAGIDEIHAELLPQDKVALIQRLKQSGYRLAMTGDGINDAPALAAADAGIAMGAAGTDIAIEQADVVLINDRLERLPLLIEISRAAMRVVRQNVWIFALGVNIASIAAAALGWIGPAAAAAVHQVSALLVVLNSLRLLAWGRLGQHALTRRALRLGHEAQHTLQGFTHNARRRIPAISFSMMREWLIAHRRQVVKWTGAALLLLWLLSGLTMIGPDEAAVVRRFGQKLTPPLDPGLHYRIPWPVEQITRFKPQQAQVVEIGFRTVSTNPVIESAEPAAYEWNLQHRDGRYEKRPDESLMLTGDENLIEVNAVIQYAVGSPDDYLFTATDPINVTRVAAESALRQVIGQNTLDTVLTSGRGGIERQAREMAQAQLDSYRAGVRVIAVQLQDVHPSTEVVDAFRNVSSAWEEKSKLINQAEAWRNEQLELARGQALARLAEAAGYTTDRANRAEGDAARFKQALEAYKRAATVTETRLYLETMEQILPGKKKMILDSSKFGRRQMLLVDPQGAPIDPARIVPATPEK
ncbi:MAG: FtsH protease activity modulator HflK [Blastocatellia bacterium]